MPHWVKVWTKRVLSLEFNSLSLAAQAVWLKAYMLAAVCDADGLLLRAGKPVGMDEFWAPHLSRTATKRALDELCFKGYLLKRADGTIEVVNYRTDQITKEAARKHRSRQQMSADSHADSHVTLGVTVTPNVRGQSSDSHNTEVLEPPPFVDKSTHSGGPAVAENGAAPWVLALKDRVGTTLDAWLPTLGLDERLTLGRYMAYRFANCTSQEPRNVKMGRKFAGQIAEMSQRKRFAAVNVREFLGAAKRVWESSGQYPLYGLWVVSAALEDEAR